MKICKDCGIVVTDVRTGSRVLFTIGDLEPFRKGTTPQLVGSDESGLGYRICVEYHEVEASKGHKVDAQRMCTKLRAIEAWFESEVKGYPDLHKKLGGLEKILGKETQPKCPKCGNPMVFKFCEEGSPPNRFVCDCEEAS